MQPDLVSIMMPAYNAARYIRQSIDSALAQTYTNWELIVVNDGSKDETGALAESYADPRIRVIHQANGGEAVARNTALDAMRGEYIAFLDADDLYLPHHLETTVSYLKAHLELKSVYTDGRHCDPDGRLMEPLSSQRRGPFEGWIFPEVVRASDVFGPPLCVLLRRQPVVERNLRFDTAIVIGPDWDFLTRYAETAHFGYIPVESCLYRVHTTNITVTVDRRRRAGYLARCREKAIHLESFDRCPVDVRAAAFYDLLVNLLAGDPDRQEETLRWPQFSRLPKPEQARLLRRMAAQAAVESGDPAHVRAWLARAAKLDPTDLRNTMLFAAYGLSPALARRLLRSRPEGRPTGSRSSPFGELV